MEPAVTSEVAQELYTELEEEVYNELEHFVADPAFASSLARKQSSGAANSWLAKLWKGHTPRQSAPAATTAPSASEQNQQNAATSQPLTADAPAEVAAVETASSFSPAANAAAQVLDASDGDGFVLVDKHDAVECLAFYIAACIQDLPEAQQLTPRQLQLALVEALRNLKRSRFQRMCAWGRSVYCWSTYTYSAVQMYQNPWLMRALITALWAASRVSLRLLL
ncbi:hypothetical protein HXX76_005015 [Chlamydomonas incerta]|uniref:Uncharacterized protein n=1 Tax=Chlamydomonas incerta TaxID=51695 RepID=A0A835TJ00_CHLIN|nr:hypothetical protein HXX76_005015 [Chlamydomonas incerta]|eukprot:KAG2439665.1 hypothetical protein HXX76_005015 [Chlamydomonas incerta]